MVLYLILKRHRLSREIIMKSRKTDEEKLKPVIHEEFEGYGISIKKINFQQALSWTFAKWRSLLR